MPAGRLDAHSRRKPTRPSCRERQLRATRPTSSTSRLPSAWRGAGAAFPARSRGRADDEWIRLVDQQLDGVENGRPSACPKTGGHGNHFQPLPQLRHDGMMQRLGRQRRGAVAGAVENKNVRLLQRHRFERDLQVIVDAEARGEVGETRALQEFVDEGVLADRKAIRSRGRPRSTADCERARSDGRGARPSRRRWRRPLRSRRSPLRHRGFACARHRGFSARQTPRL